jgi:hypothetical protein
MDNSLTTIAAKIVVDILGEDYDDAVLDYEDQIVVTRDSFDGFDATWNERGNKFAKIVNGHQTHHWINAQIIKGQPRRDVIAIDLGDQTAVWSL